MRDFQDRALGLRPLDEVIDVLCDNRCIDQQAYAKGPDAGGVFLFFHGFRSTLKLGAVQRLYGGYRHTGNRATEISNNSFNFVASVIALCCSTTCARPAAPIAESLSTEANSTSRMACASAVASLDGTSHPDLPG